MVFTDFVRELDLGPLHVLVYVGQLFLTSQVGGRVAGLLGLRRVTGYLLSGVLFAPSVLGVFREELVEHDLAFLIDVALAVIAFSIGGSLHIAKLRRVGKLIFWVTAM